ncbi:MAG: 2Fe-2S iron-sulfur cluster-binding protein [Deltaproteobacteria bacterium]|nr:2Fe-2S iron-sulfur cluster-binding protein [Deltaproteobacteria bacterium]
MPKIKIDYAEISVAKGTTILLAAEQAGIYIPHICFHPDLPPVDRQKPAHVIYRNGEPIENTMPEQLYEGCQLCVVEIEGQQGLHRSCSIPVADGMIINTSSPAITEFRRDRVMTLVAKHPHVCLTCTQKEGCARSPCSLNIPETERCCPKFEICEFRRVVEYVGLRPETPRYIFAHLPRVQDNPLFESNLNLCIGCTRCIRVCRTVCGIGALDFVFDDQGKIVIGTIKKTLKESSCRFCLSCVEVCPTGALMERETSRTETSRKDDFHSDSDLPRRSRLHKPTLAPQQQRSFEGKRANLTQVPETGGVYQLLDEKQNVIYIKGALNLRKELEEQLQINKQARYFVYEENPLYSKRESELLQHYLALHGEMPALNRELEDLF